MLDVYYGQSILNPGRTSNEAVRAGNLEIEPETFSAVLKGRQIQTTSQEYQLLLILARHAGSVLSHDYIARALWHTSGEREKRRVGVLIARLRPRLKGLRPYRLETVRNRGYGLVNRGFLNRCGSEEARAAWGSLPGHVQTQLVT
jgi:DNA-binding response OmpR family regulator